MSAMILISSAGCGGRASNGRTEEFTGRITRIIGNSALIEAAEGEKIRGSADMISVNIEGLEDIGAEEGDTVKVSYRGGVMESYPAQVTAVSWELVKKGADETYDLIPMVMVDGRLYYDTGRESGIDGRCGVMDGEITSEVGGECVPEKDGQSNFGTGYGYQRVSGDIIEVNIDGSWIVFEYRPGDGSMAFADGEWRSTEEITE